MHALVGLGNPGSRYRDTLHNAGFWVAESCASAWEGGASWKSKFNCEFLSTKTPGGSRVLIAKPQGYMNLSGQTVLPLLKYFKIEPSQVIVVHDELDLPMGRLQLKSSGGAGGHNGLKDLIESLETNNFVRLRVGIAPPKESLSSKPMADNVSNQGRDWVLSSPGPEMKELLKESSLRAVSALELLIDEGLRRAQNVVNVRAAEQ